LTVCTQKTSKRMSNGQTHFHRNVGLFNRAL
jgi:hypothetical protein